MRRLFISMMLLGSCAGASLAQEPDKPVEQGKLLAMTLCAECHAVGTTDASPRAPKPRRFVRSTAA